MSAKAEAIGSSSAFGRLLGLEILKAEGGEAILSLKMHDGLRNLHGKLHGGALFSLIDTAMGQASHSLGDGSPNSVTLECKVNYIRPVTDGELICRAWVVHSGRRTQVLEAEVHQGEKLVAKAQSTFACL
ncbi:PaaI family thioesterase [Pseudomonas stutzeri]|uniref:PaaI family thioesterase n=1 Tax=Stutzerimonas stutzeri TaxID=316 RepID=A0A2N8SS94_STUST|nr:PaaI family thioesterase [Stutzerimonas stutzeri]EQM81421.1 thioesterase [Stutzerimonas stutzeri MF28]MCQ4248071.1 PaaI family thioesterase [Stutzerimonas stutzeri]PNG05364.1 PaaI family thioesterase [Stutzerimonas stutzeri]